MPKIGFLYELSESHKYVPWLKEGCESIDAELVVYSCAAEVMRDMKNVKTLDVLISGIEIGWCGDKAEIDEENEFDTPPSEPSEFDRFWFFVMIEELRSNGVETPIVVWSLRVEDFVKRLAELGCPTILECLEIEAEEVPKIALEDIVA